MEHSVTISRCVHGWCSIQWQRHIVHMADTMLNDMCLADTMLNDLCMADAVLNDVRMADAMLKRRAHGWCNVKTYAWIMQC